MAFANNQDEFLQARLKEIRAMPPGDQRQQAIDDLSRDYPGLQAALNLDVAQSEDLIGTEMPTSEIAGPSSNPFAVEVADPFGAAAAGFQKAQGYKMREAAREGLDTLSEQQQRGIGSAMNAGMPGLQNAQSAALRRTPEEEEEYRRLMGRI